MMKPVRIACDRTGCRAVFESGVLEMQEAVLLARREGWAVSYEGGGHGWIARCPDCQPVGAAK